MNVSPILIIGYGNPLRGDDALGWAALKALQDGGLPSHVRCVTAHQLTPELAEALAETAYAVFIDAREGEAEGTCQCLRVEAHEPGAAADSDLTHRMDPRALLTMTRSLYRRAPQAVVYSITTRSFELGQPMSHAVGRALPGLVASVRAFVDAPESIYAEVSVDLLLER